MAKKGTLSPENTKKVGTRMLWHCFEYCQYGYKKSRKKYLWNFEQMHFDIVVHCSPPTSMVSIIQCNKLQPN